MKYVQNCLNFINEEQKSAQKEQWRLVNMTNSDHKNEGESIVDATAVRGAKGSTVFSYPVQFTKLREDKRVDLYQNKRIINSGEVLDIDYVKREVTISGEYSVGTILLVIQSSDITPRAIVSSLKKLQSEGSQLAENLLARNSNVETYGGCRIEDILKTVDQMNNSFIAAQGPAGCGKTFNGRAIINHLIKNNKTILVTSNSHSAINNICTAIDPTLDFKGAKICSRKNQQIVHSNFENVYVEGREIDGYVNNHQVVSGTCFALSRIMNKKFDFIIVDEASQLKMSFLLSIVRLAKNIIVLGDQNQLSSISRIDMAPGGESVLDFILQGKKVVPKEMGYFLNTTYRMEPRIASVVSEVFYEGKLGWNQTKNKHGIKLVSSAHTHGQKMSKEEGDVVLSIYNGLIAKKVKPEDIMIVTPYNAQAGLLRGLVKNKKTLIGTVDICQGKESRFVIVSCVASGNKKESSAFSTQANRLNVALSRAKDGVFLIASKGLQESKETSEEFQQVLKLIA